MNDVAEVREMLATHDPLPRSGHPLDDAAIDQMWQRLVDDMEQGTRPAVRPPVSREARRARSAVAAIAVLAVAVGGSVLVTRDHPSSGHRYLALQPLAYSRSADPLPAAATLNRLAAVAEAAPAAQAKGWYYLETAAWSTFSGSGPNDLPAGMPSVGEIWIGPTGVERIVDHADLPAPAGGLKAWLAAGLPLSGGRIDTITAPASSQFPAVLSSDPTALAKQLLDSELSTNHSGGPPPEAELLTAVKDLRAERPLAPGEQASLLRMLAQQPDLIDLGTATDRLGRPVDAFALDSDYSGLPTRYVLLFDPTNGRLLGSEDVLTKSAGKLRVPIPSVISYTIYVRDGYVPTDTSLP